MRVAVIGAGIVGACCAVELTRDGHDVTIIEPDTPGGEQAASHGNGAWISPASVVPMSMPGLWRKVPGYLLDRNGALTLQATAVPVLLPWLVRFLMAGRSEARVRATARELGRLLADSPARHRGLAEEAGVARLVESRGLLYVFADRAAFEGEALAWRLRRDNGVEWQELDAPRLRQLVPMLAPSYGFGILVGKGAHCRDPSAYVAALVRLATARGARIVRAHAVGFERSAERLGAVVTSAGPVACDRAVIAAGIGSRTLAHAAGDRVFLESERGYHAVIAMPGFELPLPVMPADGRMANTPTDAGLRLAGQVELAHRGAPPDWRRADVLVAHARRAYPGLALRPLEARWMGHRPSTPDGLPVIGLARACAGVIHAFGHGHVGLASAPITGRLVADAVLSPASLERFRPLAAARFG